VVVVVVVVAAVSVFAASVVAGATLDEPADSSPSYHIRQGESSSQTASMRRTVIFLVTWFTSFHLCFLDLTSS